MQLPVHIRRWPGLTSFAAVCDAMRNLTDLRDSATVDEIWLVEHEPVFTLGLNADRAHVLAPGTIPVIKTDRGGQVTYHGPGQLVVYPLIDIRRAALGVRDLVTALEMATIRTAADFRIAAQARAGAPGVYVGDAKLGSVGLRIRRHSSYHGLAVNVAMDLEPFSRINPCGFAGLAVTQFSDLGGPATVDAAAAVLVPHLLDSLAVPGSATFEVG